MSIISEYLPGSNSKIHETSVDFIIRKCPKEVHIVQYDKTQPIIAVQLYSNGVKYVLPTSALVNLRFSKPDNTFVYKSVLGCDNTRTIVYFDVDEQMTLLYGKVNPILELVLGETIAGSSMIPFEIDRNPIQNGDIESAIDIPAIMEDIGKANETANKANETANKALEVANEAKKITDNVATKDDVAKSASDTLAAAKDYTDGKISGIDFSAYVTSDNLTTILGDYVTKSLLNSTLSSYVTSTALNTALKLYSKTTEVDSKDKATLKSAKDYTDSEIAKIDLNSCITSDKLTAILGDYVTKAGSNKFTGSNEFADRIKIGSWLFSDGYVGSLEKGTRVDFGNASGWFAYSSDEEGANLGLYAKTADLNSYVTKTSLSTTLGGYAKTADLNSYVTKTSLSTTLGGYAKLSANNAFTGTNSFSNAISVDTINSKSTGNSIARMYYDTDKVYKVLLGSVARQITLLGSADRPYYAKNGEAFNAHSLALSEDLNGYAKLASENTFTANNTFNGTTQVNNLSLNGGILNGGSTLWIVANNSRLRFGTQDGYNVFDMWGSTEFGRLCLKNNEDDKNNTGVVFYSNVAGDYSNVAQFLYAYKDDVLLGTKSFNTWGTYKINGESMCNYRRLTCSITISGGGGGSGSAYGLYVNNVLVKIVGNISLNVSSGASATVKISWDRSQPTDWNMLNHFMMTGISGSGNSTYTATVTAWNLTVSLGLISSGSRSFVVL